MAFKLFKMLNRYFPRLKGSLRMAGLPDDSEAFLKKTVKSSLMMSLLLVFITYVFLSSMKLNLLFLFLFAPLAFLMMFFYLLHYPDMLILKRNKDINKEIVFAGRFLIIEMESGVSVYNAMNNVSRNFKTVGKYFKEIIDRIDLGTSMEESLLIAIENNPSPYLNKIYWQILNSLKTGSDVTGSLKAAMEQIVKEQMIQLNEYGRKLNPLAMFYMMIAVILPSIGVTMVIVISTFIKIELSLPVLIAVVFFLGFLQFMFYNVIRNSRPAANF